MPNFQIRATPVKVEQHDGYSTKSFEIFKHPTVLSEIDVYSPSDIAQALRDWATRHAADLPDDDLNAWSVSIVKPARWPAGYKQAGEHSHTFLVAS